MIYVQEKGFSRQIELLSFLSSVLPLSICAWLYPESKVKTIINCSLQRSDLEPVSTYENGFVPFHTPLVACSETTLNNIQSLKSVITSNCDSLALYKSGSNNWVAATIGHEGICLIKDDELFNKIKSAGFSASKEAPIWW